jgi:hypothetical protein
MDDEDEFEYEDEVLEDEEGESSIHKQAATVVRLEVMHM